jgi:hypothetical protein
MATNLRRSLVHWSCGVQWSSGLAPAVSGYLIRHRTSNSLVKTEAVTIGGGYAYPFATRADQGAAPGSAPPAAAETALPTPEVHGDAYPPAGRGRLISGVFYIGLGRQFDERQPQAYPPGAVVVLPGGTQHFHWARSGEYVTQVTAIGPLGLEYVNPNDDPRH